MFTFPREGKPEVERVEKKGPADISKKQAEVVKAITHKKEEPPVPKEPPPEYEFLADPPSISAFDLGKTCI